MMTFTAYALKNIRIDQDNAGLFCQVPSQDGNWYTVRCVESKKSVHASNCSCRTFASKQHCSHVEIAQAYYDKLYKVAPKVEAPVAVETPKVVKARKPRNGLVRKVRNGGLVRVEQPAPVAKVEQEAQAAIAEAELIVTTAQNESSTVAAVSTPAITDISKKGELYSNQGFRLLR
ncbi:MAG TPA: hypothetical protein VHV10_20580 [Ktedonobacteraceae bacterium]|jgi:hypothetical protein|nr:hypothetical protein [Ktedonobacteraceae bacterium]